MDHNPVLKEEQMETDIVVIGGGGTGLAAAVTAAEKGAKVTLLEKMGAPGGNTIMAGGLLAADSPTQKRMITYAKKDEVFKAAMEHFKWRVNPRIWRAFLEKSGDTIQWLEDMGLKFNAIPNLYPEQVFPTWHCLDGFTFVGPKLVQMLRKQGKDLGVRFLTHCPAKKILTDSKGGVTGVLAQTREGELGVTAKSVIIGTGGYGGNKELLKKYYPSYSSENMFYGGFPHVTGDGLLMAMDIGAATEGLGVIHFCAHVFTSVKAEAATAAVQPYMVWVNKRGERFYNEGLTWQCTPCANAQNRQPDRCFYSLFDEKCRDRVVEDGSLTFGPPPLTHGFHAGFKMPELEKQLQSEAGKGEVEIADSWDKIAKWIGVAPRVLKATIEEYNSFCDQGYDATFNKDRRYLQALRTPPYYAVRKRYLGFLTTNGGIRINHHMEVLNQQDNPIRGLYAGGDAAGGLEDGTYDKGIPGSSLGFALNSGRIAGENATKYALGK